MVTLGNFSLAGGTNDQKKGTFLHEFGHTLGLRHGGGQKGVRYNFKPNYFSVMNYNWQFPLAWMTPGSWPFDYSRSALPDLDELALDETAGLGTLLPIPSTAINFRYNSEPSAAQPPNILYGLLGLGDPVDWDGNGMIDAFFAQRDVNRILSSAPATPDDILEGHDDWSNLSYTFRFDSDFADGTHLDTTQEEMDFALYQELDALPLPIADMYCEGKLNSDGCVPSMSFTGFASVTDPAPFLVEAQDVTAGTFGLLVFGITPAMVPFESGFLCVGLPQFESQVLFSGGTGACGGTFSLDFNAIIQGAADPASLVGVQVCSQYGYIDAGDPFGSGLTNGLRFTIQP